MEVFIDVTKADEFCKSMKQVLETLTEIVREKDGKSGCEYLISFFNNDKDLFCRFVGFVRIEMRTPKFNKKYLVVDIWSEITMAGISLGRSEGFADAERILRRDK